ncbi:MAG: hypothetical protein H7Z13_17075 [Ferruginibacter sp.]|nr:hypothetical protein [Ferruginibacter sp.]
MKPAKAQHEKENMVKQLDLSKAQKEQMKANRENTKNQMAELKKDESITVKEYNTRKAAILKSQKEQMESLLTPEQKTQLTQNNVNGKGKHKMNKGKNPEQMKAELNLSDEQMSMLKANREANKTKAQAIKDNAQLSETEKKSQLMALKQAQKESMKQLLTPEQLKTMKERKKAHKNKEGKK